MYLLGISIYQSTFSLQPGIADIKQQTQLIRKKSNFNKVLKETILCWTTADDSLVLSNTKDHLKANKFKWFLGSQCDAVFDKRFLKCFQAVQKLLLTQALKAKFETFYKGSAHYRVINIFLKHVHY